MLACIYESPFKWKSQWKRTYPFKWKVIRNNHIRSVFFKKIWDWLLAISDHLRRNHLKLKKKCFCSKYKNAELKHITRWFEKISKTERIEKAMKACIKGD